MTDQNTLGLVASLPGFSTSTIIESSSTSLSALPSNPTALKRIMLCGSMTNLVGYLPPRSCPLPYHLYPAAPGNHICFVIKFSAGFISSGFLLSQVSTKRILHRDHSCIFNRGLHSREGGLAGGRTRSPEISHYFPFSSVRNGIAGQIFQGECRSSLADHFFSTSSRRLA